MITIQWQIVNNNEMTDEFWQCDFTIFHIEVTQLKTKVSTELLKVLKI